MALTTTTTTTSTTTPTTTTTATSTSTSLGRGTVGSCRLPVYLYGSAYFIPRSSLEGLPSNLDLRK
eukprot:8303488-Prorocentrum_lima.AAC.1